MRRVGLIAFILTLFIVAVPVWAGAQAQSRDYAADTYDLGRPHTQVMFSISHLGFSNSHGRFLDYEGHFILDDNRPEEASVEVVIHTGSVDMGDEEWNEAVRDMFKTEKYPEMTFKSTAVKPGPDDTAEVMGELTLLGVTKPVTLHVKFNKQGRDPFGKYILGFSATTDIERSDFGMTDYLPMVADDVHIMIEAEGIRRDKPEQRQYNE